VPPLAIFIMTLKILALATRKASTAISRCCSAVSVAFAGTRATISPDASQTAAINGFVVDSVILVFLIKRAASEFADSTGSYLGVDVSEAAKGLISDGGAVRGQIIGVSVEARLDLLFVLVDVQ